MFVRSIKRSFLNQSHHSVCAKAADADSGTTASCGSTCGESEGEESRSFQLTGSAKVLKSLWKDLTQKSGSSTSTSTTASQFSTTKSIQVSLTVDPRENITKTKYLEHVFEALGSFPVLEEVVFCNATLTVPSVYKLLKKSSLRSLKFQHCAFIASSKKDNKHKQGVINNNSNDDKLFEKLWKGIQLQEGLQVLEIVDCHVTSQDALRREWMGLSSRSTDGDYARKVTFQIPSFLLKDRQESSKLRRLALDGCIFENCGSNSDYQTSSFHKLIANNPLLEELKVRPEFETTSTATATGTPSRRQHPYRVKQEAIQSLLTRIIPATLSSSTTTTTTSKNSSSPGLKKLVISLDEHHLKKVYEKTMTQWIDLVQHHNFVLTELRVTHHPLLASTAPLMWESANELPSSASTSSVPTTSPKDDILDSFLHCSLQYFLRLNQVLGDRRRMLLDQANDNDNDNVNDQQDDSALMLLLSEAHDVSCLYHILQDRNGSNANDDGNVANDMGASTHSLPCSW